MNSSLFLDPILAFSDSLEKTLHADFLAFPHPSDNLSRETQGTPALFARGSPGVYYHNTIYSGPTQEKVEREAPRVSLYLRTKCLASDAEEINGSRVESGAADSRMSAYPAIDISLATGYLRAEA